MILIGTKQNCVAAAACEAGWCADWLSPGVSRRSNIGPNEVLNDVHGRVKVFDVAVKVASNEVRHAFKEWDVVEDGFDDIVGGVGFGFGLVAP